MGFLEEYGVDFSDVERVNYAALDGYCRQFDKKFFQIAYLLDFFKNEDRYKKFNCDTFNDFCLKKFKLEKTLVSRLLRSWCRFAEIDEEGNRLQCVKSEFADYNFSQLVELLPLSDSEIGFVTPEMSVKQLRDLKKKLKEEKKSALNKSPEVMLQEIQTELLNCLGHVCDKYPGALFVVSRNSFSVKYENCTIDISLNVKGL